MKKQNLENKIFGRLTVLNFHGYQGKSRLWLCICDCGVYSKVSTGALNAGKSLSCGCLNRERTAISNSTTHPQIKHRMKGTSTYNIYRSMRDRCYSKKNVSYPRYGGRGIKICKRWMKFENFLKDMGIRPEGMQLDRIDNNGNYYKKNCRWVTPRENSNNRSSSLIIECFGKSQSLSNWAREYGINPSTIKARILTGWKIDLAISTKVK